MLIGIAAMILGDLFLTTMLPKLGQEILNMSDAKKERVAAASTPIFDYLLEKTDSIDLAHTLRTKVLTSDFAVSLLEALDLSTMISELVNEQFAGQIPAELGIPQEVIDNALAGLGTSIEEALIADADPVLDYLLGISQSFSVTFPLGTAVFGPTLDEIGE